MLVDVFNDFISVEPLKNKKKETIQEAFNEIQKRQNYNRINTISSDRGGEFISNISFFNDKGIKLILKGGANKAFLVSRILKNNYMAIK